MNTTKLAQKVADNSKHPQAFEIVEALLTDQPLPEIKPIPRQYRVYEFRSVSGGERTTTVDTKQEEQDATEDTTFIRWLTDWITIDADESWPTEIVSRIAKIDLSAAQWIKDNWLLLDEERYKRFNYYKNNGELVNMFSWNCSPQGDSYWHEISRQLGE